MKEQQSLCLAREFLGKEVKVVIDRPLGSKHPEYNLIYEVNYGYIPGVLAPDGEELDAYFLGIDKPIKRAKGRCIAVVYRLDDDDSKLVVVPSGIELTDQEIEKAIYFQERWFVHKLIRK